MLFPNNLEGLAMSSSDDVSLTSYYNASCMAVSIGEVNDGVTFEQSAFSNVVSVGTKLACDSSTLEQPER